MRVAMLVSLAFTTRQGSRNWMHIVKPPCAEIVRVSDLLDAAVGDFLRSCRDLDVSGVWEAPLEGFSLAKLCIRNVEAIAVLARTDEVLAPAGWANARNAFEVAARILW